MDQLLTEQQELDVARAFARLLRRADRLDLGATSRKATKKLRKIQTRQDLSEELREALNAGGYLVTLLDNSHAFSLTNEEKIRRVAVTALEYLVDPWDVIPDEVPEHGLKDDAYVLSVAIELITALESEQSLTKLNVRPEIISAVEQSETKTAKLSPIEYLPLGSGQHFARRAKQVGILNGFQRRALFDIAQKKMLGYTLSQKQTAFFESLVHQLIESEMHKVQCPDHPCQHCNELKILADMNTEDPW